MACQTKRPACGPRLPERSLAELVRLLDDRPCDVYTSDQKLRVLATGLGTSPDAMVVCGPAAFDPDDANAITNPRLVVEVLSDSTELYDRTTKFEHDKRVPTVCDTDVHLAWA